MVGQTQKNCLRSNRPHLKSNLQQIKNQSQILKENHSNTLKLHMSNKYYLSIYRSHHLSPRIMKNRKLKDFIGKANRK